MRDQDRLAELHGRLEGIAEELADLAVARLRHAVETGEPADERRLTRARRAVEKAMMLLAEDAEAGGAR